MSSPLKLKRHLWNDSGTLYWAGVFCVLCIQSSVKVDGYYSDLFLFNREDMLLFFFFLPAFPPPRYSELSAMTCLVSGSFCFGSFWCWDSLPFCANFCQDLKLIWVMPKRKKPIHSLAVLLSPFLAWVWGAPLNIRVVYSPFCWTPVCRGCVGMNSNAMSSN